MEVRHLLKGVFAVVRKKPVAVSLDTCLARDPADRPDQGFDFRSRRARGRCRG